MTSLPGSATTKRKGKELQDTEGMIAKAQAADEAREKVKVLRDAIVERKLANENSCEALKKQTANKEALEHECAVIGRLSKTANGDIAGKQKVQFEQFVQAAYFEMIIAEANKRLNIMAEGRYELLRKEFAADNRSQSGLDLDVLDHYTGKVRSVKSLSGGESFKAALSLALGLSDVIQSYAGGVDIDTMFIDEGFGSLDKDSLDQAIKALIGLSEGNRLIGIISHVDELKNIIDKKVIISKGSAGSSIRLAV